MSRQKEVIAALDRYAAGLQFSKKLANNRPPHPSDLTPEAAIEAEISPQTYATKQLRKLGVEAVRPVKTFMLAGDKYSPSDVILPWPTAPVAGFVRRETLAALDDDDVERLSYGAVRIKIQMRVAGKRRSPGEVIEPWPTRPPRGFLKAPAVLDLLKAGLVEPASIETVTQNQIQ